MLVDYHLHTNNSFDGTQTIDELCRAAIANGLQEVAVTDHMDIFSGKKYSDILDCSQTFQDIAYAREKYRGKLTVKKGIELGQPMRNPDEAKKFLQEYELDFIIGSVHNMERDEDVGEYDYQKIDFDTFFPHYLACIYDLAQNYEYDVLGHVTYPMRYQFLQTGQRIDPLKWREQFAEIFREVIKRHKGIELNTSSIARGRGILMPEESLLRLYRDLGGTIITLGSDAHKKEQTGTTAVIGQQILQSAGFTQFTIYEHHEPRFIPL